MNKYKIKVEYVTGHSLKSYKKTKLLDLDWEKLDVAIKNLHAIKEHYQYYKKIENATSEKEHRRVTQEYKDNWWFINKDQNGMNLQTDYGQTMRQSNFWCGYFERLIEINIIGKEFSFKTDYYG